MFKLLIPIFIPSWRFFDQMGPVVIIEIENKDGQWQLFKTPETERFNLLSIFINSKHNEYLFCVTLAERIVLEKNLKCVAILKKRLLPDGGRFRIFVNSEVKFES